MHIADIPLRGRGGDLNIAHISPLLRGEDPAEELGVRHVAARGVQLGVVGTLRNGLEECRHVGLGQNPAGNLLPADRIGVEHRCGLGPPVGGVEEENLNLKDDIFLFGVHEPVEHVGNVLLHRGGMVHIQLVLVGRNDAERLFEPEVLAGVLQYPADDRLFGVRQIRIETGVGGQVVDHPELTGLGRERRQTALGQRGARPGKALLRGGQDGGEKKQKRKKNTSHPCSPSFDGCVRRGGSAGRTAVRRVTEICRKSRRHCARRNRNCST